MKKSLLTIVASGLVYTASATGLTLDVLVGKSALGDWTTDRPGVVRKLTPADLPKPNDTPSVDNGPAWAPRPTGALPVVPKGFVVTQFAGSLAQPRVIVTAPNGDLFVTESYSGKVVVLRDSNNDGRLDVKSTFVSGLTRPFGLQFYPNGKKPKYLLIANTDSVVRVPYSNGDLVASEAPAMFINNIPGGGQLRGGGHWTRDLALSKDNKTLFVSVGSISNVDDPDVNTNENRRAAILEYDASTGADKGIYASGIRNPVGLAIHPKTDAIWTAVNERDGLGDHLVPDYVTHVQRGGFYGWPYYYIGANQDPRHAGKKPELANKVIVPDVLLQSHSAALDLCYVNDGLPEAYRDAFFVALHGSWNRSIRTGYKVVRVPLSNGKAAGTYEDFMTGFVVDNKGVWGRPVGVTLGNDGALYVTDDFSGSVWRISQAD
jgi:glucose/arabinose dehydrogenase